VTELPSMEAHADALADAIEAALPGWVVRAVAERYEAWSGQPPPASVAASAAEAGQRARRAIGGRIRTLLEADIDEQTTTPLAVLREGVAYPTAVLHLAGVPPRERDAIAADMFPEDVYDLTPSSFADLDASLREPGLRWGAAKAWTHRRRHGR
jgi:hypothetical protein